MSTKISTPLSNHLLAGGSLKNALDGGRMYLFSGPVPATADEAIDGSNDMVVELTESDDGMTGLTWAASASNGVLLKNSGETWEGTALASATLSFYRFCESGDNGEGDASVSSYKRVQGTIGPDGNHDMIRPNPVVGVSDPVLLDVASIGLPVG